MKLLSSFAVVVVALLALTGTAVASMTPVRPAGITVADTAVETADAFVEQRPALVDGADADELVPAGQARGAGGTTVVRFDQELHGIPVLGGEVVVTVDARRRVVAADGEVVDSGVSPAIGPSTSAQEARKLAIAALGKGEERLLGASEPTLAVYDARIIGGPGPRQPTLVWDLEVTGGADFRKRVFIDAASGYIIQTLDLIHAAKVRHVCDAASTDGALPCVPTYARTEGGAASAVADVNGAYDFAGVTYDFYAALGRDSIDGAGMAIISTVRYCPSVAECPYENAFWNGAQMVYGSSYASADDVVAHELTHGVTEYTSKLVYWYQSGAINEAMSDILGEFVDLSNPGTGATADTEANRWLMGEDLPIGAIRDMENPPAFSDPDKMTSPFYATGTADSGGVHTNSGVANKTAFLIADGGTFNGQTVTGIGLTKSAWLWYQTELTLRFASDFGDLADALDSSCSVLVMLGTAGFTAADCTQVARAALATELRTEPANVTVPAYCVSGAPADVFNDGFDGGPASKWTIGHTIGSADLWFGSGDASPDGDDMHWTSGLSTNVRGVDSQVRSDSTMAMTTGVVVPAGESYLHFSHWYQFEHGSDGQSYDGGVIEYSANDGAWTDISALTAVNGYTGTITLGSDNPLRGRQAFVRAGNGPVATRVSLASLAGQTVKFRFRIGTDTMMGASGWFVDSVRIYGCSAGAPAISAVSPAAGAADGGTTITLTGVNLADATGVKVGGVVATNVNVVDSTTVTAVTPARTSSIVDVAVTTPSRTITKSAAYTYSLAAPTITGVSPASGTTAGGTLITITGTALTGTSRVTLGGVSASAVTVVGPTQVTAVVPAHGAGVVAVALVTPGGAVASSGAFTYVVPSDPVVTPPAPTAPVATTPVESTPVAKSPPATGTWTVNTKTDVVRTLLPFKLGTTYTIKATKGSTTRKGTCRRVATVVSCTVRAPNGRWRITITPKRSGKVGKAIVKTVKT